MRLDDEPGHGAVSEHHLRAGLEAAAGLDEALPRVRVALAQQQHLDRAAGLVLHALEPRGQHPRLVDHEHVAVAQVVDEVREDPVVDLPARAVEHEQPAAVARLRGLLGDQPARQLVVEVVGAHARSPREVGDLRVSEV